MSSSTASNALTCNWADFQLCQSLVALHFTPVSEWVGRSFDQRNFEACELVSSSATTNLTNFLPMNFEYSTYTSQLALILNIKNLLVSNCCISRKVWLHSQTVPYPFLRISFPWKGSCLPRLNVHLNSHKCMQGMLVSQESKALSVRPKYSV